MPPPPEIPAELRPTVLTYWGSTPGHQEFDAPQQPILVRAFSDGLRLILGSHNPDSTTHPDLFIERRPKGWAITMAPDHGDAQAMFYILDDGRSFVRPEPDFGPNSTITVLAPDDPGPDMGS